MTYKPRADQQELIESSARVLVVSGGAGTGKTTTAVAAARAHLEAGDEKLLRLRQDAARRGQRTQLPAVTRVLFLSFSRTAVAQIIDRAANVIGELRPRLEVSTFHGFAWRIITGFGAHHGFPPPQSVLSQANQTVPGAPPGLTYNQLMPAARQLLALDKVRDHYAGRYSLIICDEFQDTDATEWAFLQQIAPAARRILLGDVNQSIYEGSFKPGVNPAARIADAMALPGARRIELQAVSYRDPSGVLPAAAEAARQRRFTDPALRTAAQQGRLAVTRITDDTGYTQVIELARAARQKKHTVSIFTHTNIATTSLSDALNTAGLVHEQVGFTEAHAEALSAQLALVQFACGQKGVQVRRALAVFVTACLRGRGLPLLHGRCWTSPTPCCSGPCWHSRRTYARREAARTPTSITSPSLSPAPTPASEPSAARRPGSRPPPPPAARCGYSKKTRASRRWPMNSTAPATRPWWVTRGRARGRYR